MTTDTGATTDTRESGTPERDINLLPAAAPRHRHEPTWARVVRRFGWTSLTLGLLLLGFVAQQLFVTTFFAERAQARLGEEREAYFATVEVERVPYTPPGEEEIVVDPDDLSPDPIPTLLVESSPEPGAPFAVIRIPKIEKLRDGWTVVEGVSSADLKNGAGHMPRTPLPGQPGNSVISGHRTTYGAPFHDLDILEPGDVIEVETAIGTHVYEVRSIEIVRPTDVWVTDPRDGAWLTLTTCHPKFSARQRLVVFAELVDGPNAAVILGSS